MSNAIRDAEPLLADYDGRLNTMREQLVDRRRGNQLQSEQLRPRQQQQQQQQQQALPTPPTQTRGYGGFGGGIGGLGGFGGPASPTASSALASPILVVVPLIVLVGLVSFVRSVPIWVKIFVVVLVALSVFFFLGRNTSLSLQMRSVADKAIRDMRRLNDDAAQYLSNTNNNMKKN